MLWSIESAERASQCGKAGGGTTDGRHVDSYLILSGSKRTRKTLDSTAFTRVWSLAAQGVIKKGRLEVVCAGDASTRVLAPCGMSRRSKLFINFFKHVPEVPGH